MTTEVVTISSVLRDAADLIDQVGLYRGEPDDTTYIRDRLKTQCALTSINRVSDHLPDAYSWGAFRYLTEFLGFDLPGEVYNWNDTSEEGEVQRVMRLAADKYDEENL